jgi:hypothetical protein
LWPDFESSLSSAPGSSAIDFIAAAKSAFGSCTNVRVASSACSDDDDDVSALAAVVALASCSGDARFVLAAVGVDADGSASASSGTLVCGAAGAVDGVEFVDVRRVVEVTVLVMDHTKARGVPARLSRCAANCSASWARQAL